MNKTADFQNRELIFRKPTSIEEPYILEDHGTIIGRMMINHLSTTVILENEKWIFQKRGLINRVVQICKCDQETYCYSAAVRNWYRVNFRLNENLELKFRLNKFWNTSWAWFDKNKEIIIEYLFRQPYGNGVSIINNKFRDMDNLGLVVMLGWFLLVTVDSDAYGFTLIESDDNIYSRPKINSL